jgi:type VI secretion system secreted protein Hcp
MKKLALPALLVGSILVPAPGVAQDKTTRVKVQMPWLSAPGYMKIGGIDGESRDKDHDKWIDVLSVDWGSSAALPAGPGRGAGEVVITRKLDTSSPKLVEKIANGAVVPEVTLHAPAGGDEPAYHAFELENVRITSYSISTAGEVPTESITFHYEKIGKKDDPALKGKKILEN